LCIAVGEKPAGGQAGFAGEARISKNRAVPQTTARGDLRNFLSTPNHVFNGIVLSPGIAAMDNLLFCLIAQLNLVFGVAGLIWPDKLMPLFGLLMFSWPATHRAIRLNGIVAIGAYLLVLGKLLTVGH
jgi:hypothetical protein